MCKLYRLLYRLIPIKKFQSFLIKIHFDCCTHCQNELVLEKQLKKIVVTPEQVKAEESTWSEIRKKLSVPTSEAPRPEGIPKFYLARKFPWIVTASFLFILLILSITGIYHLMRQKFTATEQAATPKGNLLVIESAKVRGQPAKVYIFQPRSKNISIIWIEENQNKGG